jgi:cell wall-associated NlpC family hydrolase
LSDRDTARHRAPQRAATPLSQLTGAVTDQLGDAAGRTGAILAISTGLMAAVSVPAQALTGGSATSPVTTSSGPAAASAAPAYSALTTGGSLTAAPTALQAGGAPMTAPSTAVVSFETGTYTAVPATAAPAVRPRARTEPAPATSRGRSGDESTGTSSATGGSAAKGSSVLAIAARYVGTPYLYGGTTPRGFDCSGFTRYVYAQLGISLPRTANQQMNATRRVSRSEARPGDLVFFVSAGRAYHNGLYAGNGMMYDSPRSGKSLQKRAIWDAAVVFGRVTG